MTELTDISLSPSAASRVAAIAARQGKAPILRLSVEGGGCAGFQYRFGLADDVAGDDVKVARDGVTLVVDPVSLDPVDPVAPGSVLALAAFCGRTRLIDNVVLGAA